MATVSERLLHGAADVPPGGHFIKIDRFTGGRQSDDASGDYVVAEYFRDGTDPMFGMAFDGGFAMGQDLLLFDEVTTSPGRQVRTSTGGTATVGGGNASFGQVSSGGLY